METLNQKIEAARKELPKKKDKAGKFRKLTIVERCGKWTIGWIMFWSILAGSVWTYDFDHRNELFGSKIVTIEVAHAETITDTKIAPIMAQSAVLMANQGVFTAYTVGDGYTPGTIMASGKTVYEGAIANNCLEIGTKVQVNGKIKIVEDRMKSDRDCDHFDIYMGQKTEALKFGKQTLGYQIID